MAIARFLSHRWIKYGYETKIEGFYPDFLIPDKGVIIEAVGFDWEGHVKRTKQKLLKFSKLGYKCVVYTYPSMVHHFAGLPAKVATELEEIGSDL